MNSGVLRDSNHRPHPLRIMAAYTFFFYVLLSMNSGFCRLIKINFVYFHFKQVQFQSMHRLLGYKHAKNVDRQMAFQLYIYLSTI